MQHNELSDYIRDNLNAAHYCIYQVPDYFKYNSNFERDKLQKIFIKLYQYQLETIKETKDKSNIIFSNLFEEICPTSKQSVKLAVLILMAYYFEACDIFEEPI